MEAGSNSQPPAKAESVRTGRRLGLLYPNIQPFVPKSEHCPQELRSWAKRTGFVSTFSGETNASASASEGFDSTDFNLERAIDHRVGGSTSPKIEIVPILGRSKHDGRAEIELVQGNINKIENNVMLGTGMGVLRSENQRRVAVESNLRDREEETRGSLNGNRSAIDSKVKPSATSTEGVDGGSGVGPCPCSEPKKNEDNTEVFPEIDGNHPGGEEPSPDPGWWNRRLELRCGLRDKPGLALVIYYSLQHYLSLAGSLIFIPSIIVPLMGGSDKDTATVISTMLLVSGISTLLNSYLGTRLPLVQGSSFVFLAPALVIINSREYRNLSVHKFRHIMRELQGAIIISSIFQTILGLSGFMSLLLRLFNPIVVAPTIAAIGLAFFSYGFPQAGQCVEISFPLIALVLIFTLYLRGIPLFGLRLFRVYAVPLSVLIVWAYAFILTAGGAYNYKGCSPDIPSSNVLIDSCRKHAYTMRSCRTDVSSAWRTANWVRIPYPLQWGIPIFHMRTSLIMIFTSLVASVDSVGTYYSTSLLVNSHSPTPGIVSRGIALEGFCSILAGLWGTGTGSTALTENIHTISVTKVANRRVVEVGAILLILCSFIGKVGAILASIPMALSASILCFIWALIVALGLSNLQYGQTGSFRNMTIVGVSLFLGLSIPAYFQLYQPISSLMLPGYLIPYSAASDGPVRSGNAELDFAINGLLSMNTVVTLVVALILENTVPGRKHERGVYRWSRPDDLANDPNSLEIFSLPRRVSWVFCGSPCLGP
ncbi:hypothetical protein SAY87_029047 [Trapa incisa]|uniref:Nucleobase-ascorbate transporter 11 n=1 Tax=Trapa incisa TaxID=236973 RepID=A0AAN7KQ79_9MYRT|nr:hypothetical protein SAY87_029047 [Trapa incisa]